ncbi:tetratricopeptide repeat protein [Pelagibius marinus]|uniref:tetratricopeptide repeat protein n=1 Tax=Pelagibius marinus TaxID=2762760 RepID=UPI001872F821|nr:tetratricopeptide repeat protein [Pelagibius marinus]
MDHLYQADRNAEASIGACSELIAAGGSAQARSNAHQVRGAFLARMDRLDEAEADFNAAIALTPKSSTAYANRGNFHSLRGDRDRAFADYETALNLDPENAAAMNNTAWELARYGEYQAAADMMETVLAMAPNQPVAYDTRAHALMGLGRLEEAEAAFEKAAELGGANRVRRYQTALGADGYDPGRTDGVYDEGTRAALSACIRDNCRLLLD